MHYELLRVKACQTETVRRMSIAVAACCETRFILDLNACHNAHPPAGTSGNLLIQFEVEFPQAGAITEENRAALLQLLSPEGELPRVRVPDGDTETESWDVNGADECELGQVDLTSPEYGSSAQRSSRGGAGFRWMS